MIQILSKKDYLFFTTKQGLVRKRKLKLQNIRRNGIIAINLVDGDELLSVGVTDRSKNIILGASNGKTIKFSEDDVRQCKESLKSKRNLS